ncbi:izumo sperm-egg fusion protein 4 isoform X2 [Tachyglossus aculeatus]|uniref:izumo sperm-egg fusion protein 4 isoform X2 n=1 Tax=Tachyglossus aculeatus TaxID=9261 RepID=UPI0018F314A5|nr:izumo sperm-egg fusion protein 4 isoform X2 [Tachyglossus aculeatus]
MELYHGCGSRFFWLYQWAMVALTVGCLHCDEDFSTKFAFYRHHLSLKSWWVGDIPVSRNLLNDWPKDTMEKLRFTFPPEITLNKLHHIAAEVYKKLDKLYERKMYHPGFFPKVLRSIFQEQIKMLRVAIIERIYTYDTITCQTCNSSQSACFGYNCESSDEWEKAVKGLFNEIPFSLNFTHKDEKTQDHSHLEKILSSGF